MWHRYRRHRRSCAQILDEGERVVNAMDLGQFVEREGIDATAIGNELPNKILVYAKSSGLCGVYVSEKTATRKIASFGEVGRCNCSSCNWLIDPHDLYCRRCGARLTATDMKVME